MQVEILNIAEINTKTKEQFENIVNEANIGIKTNIGYLTILNLFELVLKRVDEVEKNLIGREE